MPDENLNVRDKYLEQMVGEQMILRYEDPSGIVTYSKNLIVREKVLF